MKQNLIKFFTVTFPFLLTVALWHLSHPTWNPGGVLALIPIFYCTFVKPVNWFAIFSVFMCMALDYKFQTVCFWIAIYCCLYAVNGFQNWIDLQRMDNNAVGAFAIFITAAVSILVLTNCSWAAFGRGIWIVVLTCAMYTPVVSGIKRVRHD